MVYTRVKIQEEVLTTMKVALLCSQKISKGALRCEEECGNHSRPVFVYLARTPAGSVKLSP